MMNNKKSLLVSVILALVMAMCLFLLPACGGTKYAVTWNIVDQSGAASTNATITVEGYDALPSEVEEGTKLSFTVEGTNGWEVSKVEGARLSGGKYNVTVNEAVTVKVILKEAVSSVNVTTNPTDLSYVAGESLNKDGMVVEVAYATGRTETVTDYTIGYQDAEKSAFSLGDTSFVVKVGNKESAPVSLAAAVEAQITLDTEGRGTINESWLNALEAREDINNFAVSEDGIVSFTYLELTEAIALPGDDDITFVEEGDFHLRAWSANEVAYSAITAENKDSLNLVASWTAVLMTLNDMYLSYETVDGVTGPYLVLDVTFEAVESAYIYLYEGNDKVELEGDSYSATGAANEKILFDLTKLGNHENGAYNGKWMDIKFRADVGGYIFEQEFILDHDAPLAEVGGAVTDGVNAYTLLTYRSGNRDSLKIAFKPYNTTYGFDVEGNELVVSGQLNPANTATHAGATATLTMGGATATGTVAADGSWALNFNISEIGACGATNFSAITFSKDGVADVTGDFNYTAGTSVYDYSGGMFSSPSYYATEYVTEDGNWAIYLGNMGSDWQTAFFSVVDIAHEIAYENVSLAVSDAGALNLVFTGAYGFGYTADEVIASVTESFYCDLQMYPSWPYRWYSNAGTADVAGNFVVTAADGVFTVVCDLSVNNDGTPTAFEIGDIIYGHFGNSSANLSVPFTAGKVTVDGVDYTLGGANSSCADWMNGLSIIYVTEASGDETPGTDNPGTDTPGTDDPTNEPAFALTGATLEVREGVAYYVLTGTYAVYTADQITFDFQRMNGWSYINDLPTEINLNDGEFEIVVNLSSVGVEGNMLAHINLNGTVKDVEFSSGEEGTIAEVTAGGKVYTLKYEYATTWSRWMPLVTVAEAEEGGNEFTGDPVRFEAEEAELVSAEGGSNPIQIESNAACSNGQGVGYMQDAGN
ncbi:MAG: hypothetical protein E7370_04045, partial [Clostridiales bacterium]|nr:hypothetical protein [Clostridiales bacterium]